MRTRLQVSLDHIGSEREPLLTIDDALKQPEELVDYAAKQVRFEPAWGPSGGYPGIRAPAPLNYVERLVRGLSPMIERAFGLEQVKLRKAECNFSLVTLSPEQLRPLQRVPHFDTVDPLQFAILHYLCPPEMGGTAFFRHRATGFETITAERLPAFEAIRDGELRQTPPSDYITGDTAHYERTAIAEARFNRVVVYRSRTLHSGCIPADMGLSPEPRDGRLTANIFLSYRQL
ncbi:DUF6445 family protein [Sphingomonas arenae]|uniref:DUF6445 family protein n=1 Tax=Sphingomonas arenae TaxID=2812555 RepID=UPI001966CFC9|nr:DUF6445 family protein [Sphingomonas arenae]